MKFQVFAQGHLEQYVYTSQKMFASLSSCVCELSEPFCGFEFKNLNKINLQSFLINILSRKRFKGLYTLNP